MQAPPQALYEAGLLPALEWLATDMTERHGVEVTVDTTDAKSDAAERFFGEDIKTLLYESVRELLLNVVKYAGVDEARIELRVDSGPAQEGRSSAEDHDGRCLHLFVEDEGRGFDADPALSGKEQEAGLGLLSICERVAALGGSLEIESSAGEDTRVDLALPLLGTLIDESSHLTIAVEDPEELPPKEAALKCSPPEESQPGLGPGSN